MALKPIDENSSGGETPEEKAKRLAREEAIRREDAKHEAARAVAESGNEPPEPKEPAPQPSEADVDKFKHMGREAFLLDREPVSADMRAALEPWQTDLIEQGYAEAQDSDKTLTPPPSAAEPPPAAGMSEVPDTTQYGDKSVTEPTEPEDPALCTDETRPLVEAEGYEAWHNGVSMDRNPYYSLIEAGTDVVRNHKARVWMTGWCNAKREANPHEPTEDPDAFFGLEDKALSDDITKVLKNPDDMPVERIDAIYSRLANRYATTMQAADRMRGHLAQLQTIANRKRQEADLGKPVELGDGTKAVVVDYEG